MNPDTTFLLLASLTAQQHRLNALRLLLLITEYSSIRSRNRLTADDVGDPMDSVWHRLYSRGNDTAFLNLMGLTRGAFMDLLGVFSDYYIVRSGPGRRGRPPKLCDKAMVLGLLLHYYCGTMEIKSLCEIFHVPPSTCARIIAEAEVALLDALRVVPEAQFRWPSFDEQRQWAALIQSREYLIQTSFGFIDGKNYRIQTPSNDDKQNRFYNGWLHSHFSTNCMCFGVDGRIIWMKLNCPGSWNDGEMSRAFRQKLVNPSFTLPGYGVVADSAFPVSGDMHGKIITPLKDGDLDRSSPELRLGIFALSNAITSIRQAAEWGVGAVQKVFRRLLLPLPYDDHVRANRLEIIHRLYNFRVMKTGESQIRNVFFQ